MSFLTAADLGVPPIFNAASYFVDRHIGEGRGGKVAIELSDLRIIYGDAGMTVSSPRAQVHAAAFLGHGDLVLKATSTAAVATIDYPGNMHVTIVLERIDAAIPKADFRVALGAARPAK